MTPSRTAIIAGNWKMHGSPKYARHFVSKLLPELKHAMQHDSHVLCILCPPAISLEAVREVLDKEPLSRVELGAQNMYFKDEGAFTGEISPLMVRELCSSVILGHSERRTHFGETDEMVNKKVQAALNHGLRPIVCVGENSDQHEKSQTEQVIHSQVRGSLSHFSVEQARKIVIAYEPIWAIGTGQAATAEGAGSTIRFIRQLYCNMYGDEVGAALRILYGGSVTSENIKEFVSHPAIDGALVGGASVKSDFVEIVRKTVEVMRQL